MDPQERKDLLAQCKGIRVTDWHDAMDSLGLFDRGLMDAQIRPLWRDTENLSHCIVGFAFTVRYVWATRMIHADSPEEFEAKKRQWYGEQPRWAEELQPGDLVVFDGSNTKDTGFIGSWNALYWMTRGAVGCVSNSGARDTDELIKEKVPVYCVGVSRGIQPNRVVVDGYSVPIECGGVYVHPGDLVIADGDGVLAIPAQLVGQALPLARKIQESDQRGRARLYRQMGLPFDFTLGEAGRAETLGLGS
jgi:regulator of RNase E activity RraA